MPFSFNGCGTMYIGERDYAPDESYLTTEWITFLFMPIFPLRSLRVILAGIQGLDSQTYLILEKRRPCWKQVLSVYCFAYGYAAWLLYWFLLAHEVKDQLRDHFWVFMVCFIPIVFFPFGLPGLLRHMAKARMRRLCPSTDVSSKEKEPRVQVIPPANIGHIEPVLLTQQPTPQVAVWVWIAIILPGAMMLMMSLRIALFPEERLPGQNMIEYLGSRFGMLAVVLMAVGLVLSVLAYTPRSAVIRPDGIVIQTVFCELRFTYTEFTAIRFMDYISPSGTVKYKIPGIDYQVEQYRILRLNTPNVEYDLKVSAAEEEAIRELFDAAGVRIR